MDGQVGAIRAALDGSGHTDTVSWRTRPSTRPRCTDLPRRLDVTIAARRPAAYQQNPTNVRESLREVHLDIEEGADIVMSSRLLRTST